MVFQNYDLRSPNKLHITFFYIFSLLCSDYVADLIKKLELYITVVSVSLKIRFGHTQISVSKIGMSMSKTACINPLYVFFSAGFCIFQQFTRRD